jgi:tetratricopeptide (TPR) repeat protein
MSRRCAAACLLLVACASAPVFAQRSDPAPPAPPPQITIAPTPSRGGTPEPVRVGPGRPNATRSPGTVKSLDPVERGLSEAAGFLRQGKVDDAVQRLRELHTANPDNWRVVLVLGRTLESIGRRDEAMALYRQEATTASDPGPTLIELQRLQREAEDWDGALATCLEYLTRVGDQDAWVADEVESLVRSDKVGPQAIRALEKARAARPDDQRLRELLIVARLHGNEGDQAMEEAAAIDRERKAHGQYLFRYAGVAQEKGLHPAALKGLDRVLQLDPTSSVREAALLARARTLRDLGRLTESAAGFDAAAAAASPSIRCAALSDQADLLAVKMRRPADALVAYQKLLAELSHGAPPDGAVTPDGVRLAIADLQIRLEQPGEAALIYRTLADSAADGEVRAEALYHAGEMLFYQGKLREAQDTWYEVVDNHPKSRWDNDALAGILMVGESNDEGGMPLTALAQAIYQRRLGRPERGLQLLDEALRQYPNARAGARLLHQKVFLLLDLARTGEARAAADSLASKYPENELGAEALLAVADQLAAVPATESEAEAVYLELLTRFPDSLQAARARMALQKARERDRGSSAREPESPHRFFLAFTGERYQTSRA